MLRPILVQLSYSASHSVVPVLDETKPLCAFVLSRVHPKHIGQEGNSVLEQRLGLTLFSSTVLEHAIVAQRRGVGAIPSQCAAVKCLVL